MVRIISGTLVEVGLGKIEPEEIKNILLEYNIYINHEHTLSYINYKKI